jgi:hypothetical protein
MNWICKGGLTEPHKLSTINLVEVQVKVLAFIKDIF